nr:protein CHROMATIN REMODELING 4-like [Ipomoea batatas]
MDNLCIGFATMTGPTEDAMPPNPSLMFPSFKTVEDLSIRWRKNKPKVGITSIPWPRDLQPPNSAGNQAFSKLLSRSGNIADHLQVAYFLFHDPGQVPINVPGRLNAGPSDRLGAPSKFLMESPCCSSEEDKDQSESREFEARTQSDPARGRQHAVEEISSKTCTTICFNWQETASALERLVSVTKWKSFTHFPEMMTYSVFVVRLEQILLKISRIQKFRTDGETSMCYEDCFAPKYTEKGLEAQSQNDKDPRRQFRFNVVSGKDSTRKRAHDLLSLHVVWKHCERAMHCSSEEQLYAWYGKMQNKTVSRVKDSLKESSEMKSKEPQLAMMLSFIGFFSSLAAAGPFIVAAAMPAAPAFIIPTTGCCVIPNFFIKIPDSSATSTNGHNLLEAFSDQSLLLPPLLPLSWQVEQSVECNQLSKSPPVESRQR